MTTRDILKIAMMKKLIPALLLFLFLGSCKKTDKKPETLEEFSAKLAELKQERSMLNKQIDQLTDKVAELDPSLQEKAKLVETNQVETSDFVRYIDIQGSVKADDPVNAVSDMGGRITDLKVKEGEYVKKGTIIAQIDVETIEKQISELETSLELAQDMYNRQERLWAQKIGSEVQYLQAKNNVERLEKSMETLKLQESKAFVYAPISGAVDLVMMKQGEVAAPGLPIVQILNTSKLKVTTDLPETYLKMVKQGMKVDLEFPSIEYITTGTISQLGRKIDPTNRTLELDITPRKSSSLLRPNLLAEIKIKEYQSKDVVTMPLEYILQEVDGTEFVYIAQQDTEGTLRAKKRYVTIGEAADGKVVITEGLTEGEVVIFKGSRNVSDGELLEISNS